MDPRILTKLRQVRAEQDETRRAVLKAESDQVLAQHFADPANATDLQELAFEIVRQAWTDAASGDIVPQVIEVRRRGLNEVDWIDENLAGLRAYWQGKGGQILSDVIRYERQVMPREEMVTAIDLHRDEIETSFWGTFDDLASQARDKLSLLPAERLIQLVAAAVNATKNATQFGSFAAATLTAANVDSVLNPVARASRGAVSILGSAYAIQEFSKVGLEFGDNVKEQIFRTGVIGTYKGRPVVQFADEDSENFEGDYRVPDDELWIVGRRAGRLTYYGDRPKVQTLPRSGFYVRWETARDAGMLLYGADKGRIGRIKLT